MNTAATARSSTTHLLTILFALLIAGCKAPEPRTVIEAPRVMTTAVVVVDIEERIEVTGEIQARLHTVVSSKVHGAITEILVDEGEPVSKGTVVLEIDPQRRQLELKAAQARKVQTDASLQQQQRQVDRVRRLHHQGVASKLQLDEAELQLQLAEANDAAESARADIARQSLDDATIRAPFTGVVGQREVNLGEFVQVGTPLLEFVSLDPVDVVFHVAEVDSALVLKGQSVDVRVAPYPNETFKATVRVIHPTIDRQSRTLRVKATLPNPMGRLRPGLFARADLGIAVRSAVPMVPDEAVLQRSDGAVLFCMNSDSRVERRNVEIGTYRDGMVEIVSGVTSGDVVVTRGHMDLLDGSVVQVVEGAKPARDGAAGSEVRR